MSAVSVTAKSGSAPASTPAERRRNPVTVSTGDSSAPAGKPPATADPDAVMPPSRLDAFRDATKPQVTALQTDLTGGETPFRPGSRSTIGLPDRAPVGRERAIPDGQQLGLFADESKQMKGQGALLDALLDVNADAVIVDPYDRPTVTSVQRPELDAPTVPASFHGMSDDEVQRLLAEVSAVDDQAGTERILAELDRRDNADQYAAVVASVPDAETLRGMPEDDVTDLFVQVISADNPDAATYARLGAELDRRTELARVEREEAPLREFIAQTLVDTNSSEDDLALAADHARTLGDDNLLTSVFVEWERRERAERAEAERQAAAEAQAERERLAAEKAAAEAEAARVAAELAESERLATEMRNMSPYDLSGAYVANKASMDPAKQRIYAAAEVELARRSEEQEERRQAVKRAESRRRWTTAPVDKLTDDELRDSIADHEADGWNTNSVRQRRLGEMQDEQVRRDAEARRLAELAAAVPTAPLRIRNPVAVLGQMRREHSGISTEFDRIRKAQMLTLGVGKLDLGKAENYGPVMRNQAWRNAADKAIKKAAGEDPRGPGEQAAMALAHYQHLAKVDGVKDADRLFAEDPSLPPMRPSEPPVSVSKGWDRWQEIKEQAYADAEAGNTATADRYRKALARAYGLPDDATDREIGDAYRVDLRSESTRAASYLGELRALARTDGVDPTDRLRFGPPERALKSVRPKGGHQGASTPEQEARIDELVAKGYDWLEAYADVHGYDVETLRRDEAGLAASGGSGRGGATAALRKAYDEHVHLQYLDAETVTRGNVLSKAGQAAGIDPVSLFSGPLARARKYASEELLRYWVENPRMNWTEFQGNVTGKARVSRLRARESGGAQGKDFAA